MFFTQQTKSAKQNIISLDFDESKSLWTLHFDESKFSWKNILVNQNGAKKGLGL